MPLLAPLLPLFQAQQADGAALSADRVAELRAAAHSAYRSSIVPLYGARAEDVAIDELSIDGPGETAVALRVYRPQVDGALPVYLYLHGGGFWAGEAELFDVPCSRIAAEVCCVVVSVDYGLAPENPFPGPVNDSYAALLWVHANAARLGVDAQRMAVGGASAGGGLAAAVTRLARDNDGPEIVLQILEAPAVDLRPEALVRIDPEGAPIRVDGMAQAAELYVQSRARLEDPLASPGIADDLAGLPPALIMTAEYDPLRGGGDAYAQRLAAAGVRVSHHLWRGQFHGSQHLETLIPEQATAYYAMVVAELVGAFGHGAPSGSPHTEPTTASVATDDGIELRVQCRRHDGGQPLVLVHGYTGGLVDWDPVADDLAADRTVITYDHRGHGRSDRGAAASYTIDQLVADLASVLAWTRAELGVAQVDMAGHSLGGVVAMIYAVAHQDEIASLILMGTAGGPEFQVPEQVAEMAAVGRVSGMDVVAQLVVDFLRSQDGMPQLPDDVVARMAAKLAATDVEAFDAMARELNSFPPVNGLGTLDLPATIVVGEMDAGLREPAQRLASAIPGADLVVIPSAGHSPQDDAPTAVLEAFRQHFERG